MPFETPRMISDCDLRRASVASTFSSAIASSTLRMKVRIRDRLERLFRARSADCRARFFACLEFAILPSIPLNAALSADG